MTKAVECETGTFFSALFGTIFAVTTFIQIFFLVGCGQFYTYFVLACGAVAAMGGMLDPNGGLALSLIAIETFILFVIRILGLISGPACLFTLIGLTSLTLAIAAGVRALFNAD